MKVADGRVGVTVRRLVGIDESLGVLSEKQKFTSTLAKIGLSLRQSDSSPNCFVMIVFFKN
ncbi:hypothetical protein [Aeromonas sp. 600282]|uniref:hypothetical protein n=1 Tax=Aeromonas sp. 600282 TaxID=2712027 RepID=UPI003B9FC489